MQTVEVWIKGHLDLQWSEWLDGFTLTHTEQGETILTGQVNDQAAFYGLIFKLRDLGVCLIRVEMK
jgi:hypothetical protein